MFGRRSRGGGEGRGEDAGTLDRPADKGDADHLRRFVDAHPGVEVYLEPRTNVTGTTVVLVAASGEWTRRRIGDAASARSFARKHKVPLYDAAVTGYPARMRAWTAARSADERCRPPGLRGR